MEIQSENTRVNEDDSQIHEDAPRPPSLGYPSARLDESLTVDPELIALRREQNQRIIKMMGERSLGQYHHTLSVDPERIAERRKQNKEIVRQMRERSTLAQTHHSLEVHPDKIAERERQAKEIERRMRERSLTPTPNPENN